MDKWLNWGDEDRKRKAEEKRQQKDDQELEKRYAYEDVVGWIRHLPASTKVLKLTITGFSGIEGRLVNEANAVDWDGFNRALLGSEASIETLQVKWVVQEDEAEYGRPVCMDTHWAGWLARHFPSFQIKLIGKYHVCFSVNFNTEAHITDEISAAIHMTTYGDPA